MALDIAAVMGAAFATAAGTPNPAAIAAWTAFSTVLIAQLNKATVTISPGAQATGVTPGGAAVPVTGTAVIT